MNLIMLLYPSVLFFVFIFAPALLVAVFAADTFSTLVFKIAAIGFVTFTASSFLVYLGLTKKKDMTNSKYLKSIMFVLFFIFCCSYVVLVFDYHGLPVIEYLIHGGSPNQLRSEFYKEKQGFIQVAVYIRSILTKGFIPLYAVYAFIFYKRKMFIMVFVIYLFFSLMTFEKSAILWFVLPLIFLFIYQKKYKRLVACVSLIVVVVFMLGALQHSEPINGLEARSGGLNGFRESFEIRGALHEIDRYQFFFTDIDNKTSLPFLLDRMFWIPFVTMYDTILFWSKNYDDVLLFSTNRHLAKMTGYPFANIERKVFIFQYGGGDATTGNANASFIAEAYLMFGFLGVVFFSAIFGFINGLIVSTGNVVLICAFSVYPYAIITSASFLSMMFSGGLFLYLLLAHALMVRYKL